MLSLSLNHFVVFTHKTDNIPALQWQCSWISFLSAQCLWVMHSDVMQWFHVAEATQKLCVGALEKWLIAIKGLESKFGLSHVCSLQNKSSLSLLFVCSVCMEVQCNPLPAWPGNCVYFFHPSVAKKD